MVGTAGVDPDRTCNDSSFDHLVGARNQHRRDFEAERLP
jgi:hypothetical protein